MKIVWLVFRKDLVRHRLALALWVFLLLGEVALQVWAFSDRSADAEWFTQLQGAATALRVIVLLFTLLLVGSWVLEDPLVGSSQFWVTRPIGGGRLLAAKALGVLVVFVGVPAFVDGGFAASGGIEVLSLANQLFASALPQAGLVASAFVIATLADRLARFVTLLVIAGAAAVTYSLWIARVLEPIAVPAPLAGTRLVSATMLLALATAIAAALQFTVRRPAWAIVCLVVGCALAGATLLWLPWTYRGPGPMFAERTNVDDTMTLTLLRIGPAQSSMTTTPEGQQWIDLWMRPEGVPAGQSVVVAHSRFVFVAGDGRRYETERMWSGASALRVSEARTVLGLRPYAFADDEETKNAINSGRAELRRRRKGGIEQAVSEGGLSLERAVRADAFFRGLEIAVEPTLSTRLSVPEWVEAGLAAGSVRLAITSDLRLGRWNDRGEMPLRDGGMVRGGWGFGRIVDRGADREGEVVVVTGPHALGRPVCLVVVNRALGTIAPVRMVGPSRFGLPSRASVRTVVPNLMPKLWRGERWVEPPGAREGLAVAVLELELVGSKRIETSFEQVPWRR